MNPALKQRWTNMRRAFSSKQLVAFALASGFIFGLILFSLSKVELISTNMGDLIGDIHFAVIVVLSLLFGVNIALLSSRIVDNSKNQKRIIGTTSVASILGILFAGCATCGLTLASYIGLGSVAAFLPWNGIEVNLIASLLLIYSIWNLSANAVCNISIPKKPKIV